MPGILLLLLVHLMAPLPFYAFYSTDRRTVSLTQPGTRRFIKFLSEFPDGNTLSLDPRICSDRVESPNSQSGSLKVRVNSTYSHPLASKLVHSSIQDTAPMAIDLKCILFFYFLNMKKRKEKKCTLEYNPIKQWTENLYEKCFQRRHTVGQHGHEKMLKHD